MKLKHRNILILSVVSLALLFSIKTLFHETYNPKDGDFLFQNLDCGPICEAIEEVTWGVDSAKFSHIGLVIKDKGEWKVLESISKGVVLTPVDDFLNRSLDTNGKPKIWVGRLKEDNLEIIKKVKYIIPDFLGIKYDDEFIYENGSYYCSELIYDIFKKANNNNAFFTLEPMTFKSLQTKEYFPVWIEYYKGLNRSIPQDSLGINPAGISRSDKIIIVEKLGDIKS